MSPRLPLFLTLGGGLVLLASRVEALAASSVAAEARVASAAAAEASREIPVFKLDQAFDPAARILGSGNGEPGEGASPNAISSSLAQDQGRCPIVKLPSDVTVVTDGSSWRRQWGGWSGLHGSALASWEQNVFRGHGPDAVYISDVDGRHALKVLWRTEAQLRDQFGWSLDISGDAVPEGPGSTAAIVDCAGELLFVVMILTPGYGQGDASALPQGGTYIYDRVGGLLASTIEDFRVSRQQFVDGAGHLLAISESPGLDQNVPRNLVPTDPKKGDIRAFGLHFERGGYEGASRLLDVDYRYAIATAVQVRAIYEATPASFPSKGLSGTPEPVMLPLGSGGLSGTVGFRPGDYVTRHKGGHIVDGAVGGDDHHGHINVTATASSGYYSNRPSQWAVTAAFAVPTTLCLLGLLFCLGFSFHAVVFPEEQGVTFNPFITLWHPGLAGEKRHLLAKSNF